MPPAIQVLAEKARMSFGTDYFISVNALRHYIAQLSDLEFEQEMGLINNPYIFGVLWSVGLSFPQQAIASKRHKELEK